MTIKGRRTVISIRGEDAEYLMPALREVEVERMKKGYVCEWCGEEVGPEDQAEVGETRLWYCQDNPECERKLFDIPEGPTERRGG